MEHGEEMNAAKLLQGMVDCAVDGKECSLRFILQHMFGVPDGEDLRGRPIIPPLREIIPIAYQHLQLYLRDHGPCETVAAEVHKLSKLVI